MQDMVEPEWQHPDTPGLSTGGPVRDRFQYSNWTAYTFTPLCFITSHDMYYVISFLFSLEKDDMESSKRCVKHLSLIFIVKY